MDKNSIPDHEEAVSHFSNERVSSQQLDAYLRFCCELDKEKPCSYACTLQEAKASCQLS